MALLEAITPPLHILLGRPLTVLMICYFIACLYLLASEAYAEREEIVLGKRGGLVYLLVIVG